MTGCPPLVVQVNDLVHHGHIQVPQSLVLPETEVSYTLERENLTKVLGSMTLWPQDHIQAPLSLVLPETEVPFTLERENVTNVLGSMTLSPHDHSKVPQF
jgi:hypothetical protein